MILSSTLLQPAGVRCIKIFRIHDHVNKLSLNFTSLFSTQETPDLVARSYNYQNLITQVPPGWLLHASCRCKKVQPAGAGPRGGHTLPSVVAATQYRVKAGLSAWYFGHERAVGSWSSLRAVWRPSSAKITWKEFSMI